MGKKIRMGQKQVNEIIGTDIDYLNNDGYKEYNGNSEVSLTGKLPSSEKDGKPITTDKFASMNVPRGYFGVRNTTYTSVRENKELHDTITKIVLKKIKGYLNE